MSSIISIASSAPLLPNYVRLGSGGSGCGSGGGRRNYRKESFLDWIDENRKVLRLWLLAVSILVLLALATGNLVLAARLLSRLNRILELLAGQEVPEMIAPE